MPTRGFLPSRTGASRPTSCDLSRLASCLMVSHFLLLSSEPPLRPHLCEPVHVDGRALALFFAAHRLEQIERFCQVLLNRLARRLIVETFDLGVLLVGGQHPQRCHVRFRRRLLRNSSNGRVLRT